MSPLPLTLATLATLLAPAHGQPPTPQPPPLPLTLTLAEVIESITNRYPPFLAALVERDLADGRLQSAQGAFDFLSTTRLFGTPAGYYESRTVETGFEQFTSLWGSTLFGGYRITRGLLPDYDPRRTQSDGEFSLGLRLPFLRGGPLDPRRASLAKARLDQSLADPTIQRQQLDFLRSGTVAYYLWLSAGQRERAAESLLHLAQDRVDALTQQANSGLIPRLVLTDNQQLVAARQIAAVQARRRFEAASLALSLFLRNPQHDPVVATRDRLPNAFPAPIPPSPDHLDADIEQALARRPELSSLDLALRKLDIDRRLARNQRLPNLDATAVASQDIGDELYKDKSEFELQAGVELRLPLQRREARGRLAELDAQTTRLENEQRFARDRIRTETRDAFSALQAAFEQIQQTALNLQLARDLQSAETERFRQGATDFLALQLRERTAFEAELLALDALTDFFRAHADYRAATAADLPPPTLP